MTTTIEWNAASVMLFATRLTISTKKRPIGSSSSSWIRLSMYRWPKPNRLIVRGPPFGIRRKLKAGITARLRKQTINAAMAVHAADSRMNRFAQKLAERSISLRRTRTEILQVNVGKLCNLTCVHCHVNAGPKRKEIMNRETAERIINWLAKTD